MKLNKKKVISMALATATLLSSSVGVFAANRDFHTKDGSKTYEAKDWGRNPAVFEQLLESTILEPGNLTYEFNGVFYDYEKFSNKMNAATGDINDAFAAALEDESLIYGESQLKVESVSAINNIKLGKGDTKQIEPKALDAEGNRVEGVKYSFTSSNPEVATVSEGGLVTGVSEGSVTITVTTTNAVENKSTTVNVSVVNELKDMEMKITPESLVADGKTVMEVEVTLNTPNADKMGGMLRINSKLGLKASKVEEALDKGKATFKITLPSSVEELKDTITVSVKSHDKVEGVDNNELVGLEVSQDVVYKAMGTEGGSSEQVSRSYTVESVRSMDVADRVAVYVGMNDAVDLEDVKEAVVKQVKLYNSNNSQKPLNIIKIQEVKKVENGYAFISLIDLGDGTAADVLHDNQYNYYSVATAAAAQPGKNDIKLNTKEFSTDNRFMLIDGKRPEVRNVEATLNDGKFLPNDSILVEFNEPVNKVTAEKAANWTINGKNLENQVKKITLLDVAEGYGTPAEAKEALKWGAIEEGKERNLVIIELKPSFARNEIKNGQNNLLQVKSVADWAGMTDLSDNNKISTQDFTFMYNVPETEQELSIVSQSPEQFVLELGDMLYTDQNLTEFDASNTNQIEVTLEGTKRDGKQFTLDLTNNIDYAIRKVTGKDTEYILELTRDWTEILTDAAEADPAIDVNAYHGKTFKVSIKGNTYNVYGEQVTGQKIGEDEDGAEIKATLDTKVKLNEDNVSPLIVEKEVLYNKDADNQDVIAGGNIKLTMSEPVQLSNDGTTALTKPNLTPTKGNNVSQPEFEYVMIKDAAGNDLTSKGVRVAGEIVTDSVDVYDREFIVKPSTILEPGDWKLVVRAISDDVGNTMSTEEAITFTIPGAQAVQDLGVEPYLVWGYAVDDVQPGTQLDKDYVVLLFSREMDIDVLKSSTYNINGKQIDQDAKITDELVPLYEIDGDTEGRLHSKLNKNVEGNVQQWMGHLVTIELPKSFIETNKDTNALTLPNGLKAVNDNVEDTRDVLLGDTQYQLDFSQYDKLTGLVNDIDAVLPAFTGNNADAYNDMDANKTSFIANVKNLAAIQEATVAVEQAETDETYVSKIAAQGKVTGLQAGSTTKTTLQDRLDAIKTVEEQVPTTGSINITTPKGLQRLLDRNKTDGVVVTSEQVTIDVTGAKFPSTGTIIVKDLKVVGTLTVTGANVKDVDLQNVTATTLVVDGEVQQ